MIEKAPLHAISLASTPVLCYLNTKNSALEGDYLPLTPAEQAVLAKRKKNHAKNEFLASRTVFKAVLSNTFAISPKNITVLYCHTQGRLIASHQGEPLPVNLCVSHSKEAVLCGFWHNEENAPFGLDLEWQNTTRRFNALSARFYHPDETRTLAGPETCQRFYTLWTNKEALAKAIKTPIARILGSAVAEELNTHALHAHTVRLDDFTACCVLPLQEKTPVRWVALSGL